MALHTAVPLVVNLLCLCIFHTSAQNLLPRQIKCYDDNGNPQRCEPQFSNPAFGLPIEATNTCGETLINDASGRRYTRSQLEEFRRFFRQTGASGATKYQDFCDNYSDDPTKRHPPSNMVDRDSNTKNRTWWQSITLYEYKGRNLGDMVEATITLNFGKAYDITYVSLKFLSSRPESFSIFKRTSETSDWEPFQFYSASCRRTYNMPQNGAFDKVDRAICTGEYSDIAPLTGGTVVFGTLDGRPGITQFDRNKILQEFVTATALQIRLKRLNTFGDEIFEDRTVLQSYYYSLSDVSVGGRCKCNGHADRCVEVAAEGGGGKAEVCVCQHNTTGADCEQCLRTHNDRPWAPATIDAANACGKCQCNGRSELCHFDQDMYDRTGSGGVCEGCRGFTDGPHCERCRTNYYRVDNRQPCSACNCDSVGSVHQQCDTSGQCQCKPGVTGRKCDRCQANFYDFGSYGCRPCNCQKAGSFENTPYCDSNTGLCSCKENVEGQDCGQCKPGYFNLDENNKFGCIACFCNGKTSECSSARGYVRDEITSYFDRGNEGWTILDRFGNEEPSPYNVISENLVVASSPGDGEFYFNAPDRFLGDQQLSYNQFLEFTLRIDEAQGRPSRMDVKLEGDDGRSVSLRIFAQNNSVPSTNLQTYRFRLNEHPLYQWTPTSSALEFQRILSSLTAIKIRGNYNRPGRGFLDDVKLYTAHNGQQIGDISSVEQCQCPQQYIGQHCESCAPGYRRQVAFGGRKEECVPCECNGHSQSCDADSGACICQHDTRGHNCEKCKEGWYGNAEIGTPDDCTPCPCPGQGACFEQLDMTVSCLECPPGYSGDLCDMCEDGYFGDLSGGDNCTQCDCNGNVDSNAVGNCNTTNGVCLKCIFNTGGDKCESCLSGFYGNATGDVKGDCKPCECNEYGTNSTALDVCEEFSGQCSCLPHVTGRQCNECEDGYYDLESTEGCKACLCDTTGSTEHSCDLRTGQCVCKPGIGGKRCDICIADYYDFSETGCVACDCLEIGSAHGQCDNSGQCVCKDPTRITGLQCDMCHENKYNLTAGCLDCPACYNLVQDAVEDIRQGLIQLGETLKNIKENPVGVDDRDFTDQLDLLSQEINRMLSEAQALQGSGGSVSDELKDIQRDLAALKKRVDMIMEIVDEADLRFSAIDLLGLDERIEAAGDEVSMAKDVFSANSSYFYGKILAILGDSGPVSGASNMTMMAQRSTAIVEKQEDDSKNMTDTANRANKISSEAYSKAVEVVTTPQNFSDQLDLLNSRIGAAKAELTAVEAVAREAQEKATKVYNGAIEGLSDVKRVVIPPADTQLPVKEAEAIYEDALAQLNETNRLLSEYAMVMNDSSNLLAEAELTYTRTYQEQQVTDALMAEVDVAYEKANQAIEAAKGMLKTLQEQLKSLLEFDERVKFHKALAQEALAKIPEIENILGQAENATESANEALEGANQAANEAMDIAQQAKLMANEASTAAADIAREATATKMEVDAESQKTNELDGNITAVVELLDNLEPQVEADQKLMSDVLNESERAKRVAVESVETLRNASKTVEHIVESLDQLSEVNTTELERLEQEMDDIEELLRQANIESQLKELQVLSDFQRNAVKKYSNFWLQLRADVENIVDIVNSIPGEETCFSKPVLEPKEDKKKRRRRLRKLRKRMRH